MEMKMYRVKKTSTKRKQTYRKDKKLMHECEAHRAKELVDIREQTGMVLRAHGGLHRKSALVEYNLPKRKRFDTMMPARRKSLDRQRADDAFKDQLKAYDDVLVETECEKQKLEGLAWLNQKIAGIRQIVDAEIFRNAVEMLEVSPEVLYEQKGEEF